MISLGELNRITEMWLPEEEDRPGKLTASMNYAVKAGGKRLRPQLLLETYRAFGGT